MQHLPIVCVCVGDVFNANYLIIFNIGRVDQLQLNKHFYVG